MSVDGFDHGERDRLVGRNDTAVRALGIARERTLEGFGDSDAVGRSAGILMLEDHDGRIVEFAHDGPAGVRVEDVVVAPASINAFSTSYSQFVPGNIGIKTFTFSIYSF